MRLGARRAPFTVLLNKSLAPSRLLSFSTKGELTIDDFVVSWGLLHADGVDSMGDSLFESVSLSPATYLDLFVYDPTQDGYQLDGARHMRVRPIPPGKMLCLSISWSGINGKPQPGRSRIMWSYDELRAGVAPRIAFGQECDAVDQFKEPGSKRVTAGVLKLRRRLRGMKSADIRERSRREESTINMDLEPIRMTKISLRGTRGFRDSEALALASPEDGRIGSGLTVVVGANNAGKSTVWEAFEVLARKSVGSEVDFSEGRRNRNTPGGVNIKLERSDGTEYVVESWPLGSSRTRATGTPLGHTDLVVVPSRRQFQPNFGRHGGTQINWMSSGQEYSRTQIRDPFTGRLFNLHDGDETRRREFDALLAEVVGEPINWAIELGDGSSGNSHYLKITIDASTTHSSEGLGEGIISLLFVLDSVFSASPGTAVVIDEPELSLHPQLVYRLGKVLARFAADHQIVIFTHSPHLVNWDLIASGAEVARVYKDGAVSRIAQPTRETISRLTTVRRGNLNNPHVLGNDANEALFLDERVVLVEGQEDVVLLPRAFQSLGLPVPENYFGWGAGGAPNMEKIMAFLKELGFRHVAAILDNNVPEIVASLRNSFPEYLVVEIPAPDIRTKSSVPGLLDDKNQAVRPELRERAKTVLKEVIDYLTLRSGTDAKPNLTNLEASTQTLSADDPVE